MEIEEKKYIQDITYPPRVMSGIQPCNRVHLGHYFGALKNQIQLHHRYPGQSFYMIADYHSLTKGLVKNNSELQAQTIEIATTYLALGLDPTKAFLYIQSDIPELMELTWIFGCISQFGPLNRLPTFKSSDPADKNAGLLTYPVLMSSDILSLKANIIPVGKDQLPYVENARNLAERFNNLYEDDIFPIPKPDLGSFKLVKGTNGKKMSFKYENYISLFSRFNEIKEKVNSIVTEDVKANEKKNHEECNIFHLYSMVASPNDIMQMKLDYESGSISFSDAKEKLTNKLARYFGEYEEEYHNLKNKPDLVMDVLREGFRTVRKEAQDTLTEVRELIGIKKSI